MWRKDEPHISWDDLNQGAWLLAAVCMKTWDKERGTFGTYYFNAAKNPERYMGRSVFDTYSGKHGYNKVLSTNYFREDDDDETNVISRSMHDENECVEDIVEAADESKRLAAAIKQLPDELQSHALDILNERVDWSDIKVTVDLHRRTLEALREEMT